MNKNKNNACTMIRAVEFSNINICNEEAMIL